MHPLVSIIIPIYNRSSLIGETLDSIISQTYTNWECIVIDDGSTDYTPEIVQFYCEGDPRIKFFFRASNMPKGPSACRNYGYELSKGEYINWFDSDDLMHYDFLRRKIQTFKNENAFCCISRVQFFSIVNGEKKIKLTTTLEYDNLLEDLIQEKISIATYNPLWKKDFLKKFQLFDETLKHSEDLEFHSRIFSKDDNIEVIDEVLVYVRTAHSSISNDFYKQFPDSFNSYLDARKKILFNTKGNFKINKIIIRQLLSLLRYLLCKKQYRETDKILSFIKNHSQDNSFKYKWSFFKLYISYQTFKTLGRGETRFKKTLYLP